MDRFDLYTYDIEECFEEKINSYEIPGTFTYV